MFKVSHVALIKVSARAGVILILIESGESAWLTVTAVGKSLQLLSIWVLHRIVHDMISTRVSGLRERERGRKRK